MILSQVPLRLGIVLVCFFFADNDKYYDQGQLGVGKGLFPLTLYSSLREEDRNSRQELSSDQEGALLMGLLSYLCSPSLPAQE